MAQAEPHFALMRALDDIDPPRTEPAAEFRLDGWRRARWLSAYATPCDLPLLEVAAQIKARDFSPVEATERRWNGSPPWTQHSTPSSPFLASRRWRRRAAAETEIAGGGYRGPLHGIPLSVKDLFATKGIRTTASSRVLAEHVPDDDATVVTRLREAGAVIIGKTNMLEFAYAAVHPDFGPTPNPWDLTPLLVRFEQRLRRRRRRRYGIRLDRLRHRAARSGSRRPTAASSG